MIINPIKYDVTYVYRETLYLIEFAYYKHMPNFIHIEALTTKQLCRI